MKEAHRLSHASAGRVAATVLISARRACAPLLRLAGRATLFELMETGEVNFVSVLGTTQSFVGSTRETLKSADCLPCLCKLDSLLCSVTSIWLSRAWHGIWQAIEPCLRHSILCASCRFCTVLLAVDQTFQYYHVASAL